MKRSYEFQGNTITIEAKVWQKPDRPTMVFFSRGGKQVAAWNVTAQKWSPKTSAGVLFLDALKREFSDIMSSEAEAVESARPVILEWARDDHPMNTGGDAIPEIGVIEALLTIIPAREENGLDYSKPLPPLQGPMPKSWYEKKAHNDALLEKNLHSAAEWRAKMEA